MKPELQYYVFATNSEPHCLWDVDMGKRNSRFLKMIDPGYFEYQGSIYGDRLRSDPLDKRAATALRVAYFHGLESFFALLCAFLQAPLSIPAWLLRYKTSDLREAVEGIGSGSLAYPGLTLPGYSWDHISAFINDVAADETIQRTIVDGYARTWQGFAEDYLSAKNRSEYNSLKHGFRVRPGGFSMAFRREKSRGVADPEAPVHSLGGSTHGIEYMTVEEPKGLKPNFRLRQVSKNWAPKNLENGLYMISSSIQNIVTRAMVLTESDEKPKFATPPDASWYASPWRERVQLESSTMDYSFKLEDLPTLKKAEIVRALSAKTPNSLQLKHNDREDEREG